jgi:3-phenylpropionate/trans-cinnamate dioxygenase ferredoxin reductase subunit
MGLEVTVIAPASVPLEHQLGPEAGAIYRDIHTDQGVKMRLGSRVERFEGSTAVQRVVTTNGRAIDCDFVVVGVGATPNVQLAAAAGVTVEGGIVCDEFLQTSLEGVFAAGDVASVRYPTFGRLRVEHWATALNQGPAAARNMLDHAVAYDRVPYFYSDQYDVGMEYSGHARGWDDIVFRGDVAGRRFIAFWCKEQRVLAGMNVNVWDVTDPIKALIRSCIRVDRARLADPDTPLEDLAPDIVAAS